MANPRLSVLARLSTFSARHPWRVVTAWLLAVALALVAADRWPLRFVDRIEVPGADSLRVATLLEAELPDQGSSATVIFARDDGAADPSAPFVLDTVAALRGLPHLTAVGALEPSADGRALLADLSFDTPAYAGKDTFHALERLADRDEPGWQLAFGGELVSLNQEPEPGSSEILGLVVALGVIALAFRSAALAVVPLLTAVAATTLGVVGIGLCGRVVDVSTVAPMLASMLGLGVGVDYALFFVTRVREELGQGRPLDAAIVHAADHAGRAIVFAGLCVLLALGGLIFTRVALLMVLGLAAGVVTTLSAIAALTLLPALLRLAGRFLHPEPKGGAGFVRFAALVARAPLAFATGAILTLLAIAAPSLDMHLGFPDDSAQPAGSLARRAYDLTARHYGAGRTGPLVLAIEAADPTTVAAQVAAQVQADPAVAAVSPPLLLPSGRAALMTLIPTGAPQDPPVVALVHQLRDEVAGGLPDGARLSVGGVVATTIDVAELIAEQLPLVLGVVLSATFLLLLVVFRSILVPLKAVAMNLLSVAAAYGVLVAVFQWGWGRSLLGLDHATPISSILPLLLFTLLFGLSMDYEVFLLTRVREEHDRGRDTTASVAVALGRTGRVVTSAAAIMVVVFVAFATGPDPIMKMFGVGLASAIFLDATVVRAVLVPATMVLLGEANWWLPRPLHRWLPSVQVD